MKFRNGAWLNKEGVMQFSPKQVYFSEITKDMVKLCAPTSKILNRGATIGGVNLTVEITSPCEDVLKVTAYHHKGVNKKFAKFEILEDKIPLAVEETEEMITINSGKLKMVINKENWSVNYYRGTEKLTSSEIGDLAYVKTDYKGDAYDKGSDAYMKEQLSLSVGECVYGLGERFTPFVKNGQSIDIWNEDGGTDTEQSYKNIPFYLTNKGYGVLVNDTGKVSFEVGTESATKTQFSVKGEKIEYYIICGDDMKDVIKKYTDLTGKPSLPPEWSFGLWLSTSFTTSYDEKTVLSFIDGMNDRNIPLSVFHFDCFWMKDFHWSDFLWDSRVFPDPQGMLKKIKSKGLKVCVWINPYIAQDSILFDEGMEKGYFIKRQNGDVWQWDLWQPGMAIVDFTNPDACKWFKDKLKAVLDTGVDCFKTDFGERIPTDVVYFDGKDAESMHNFYTYLYNKTVYELLVEEKGKEEAILFARSATVGGQKFPVHWGGDCWSNYGGMAESLRGGLSLTMSGFGYWSHDMGGFESTSTADVYKRWAAFGLLSSHSRLHGSSSYRVPWVYDDEAVDVVRTFTNLKTRLTPYLWTNAIETAKTGIPMMRSMVLENPNDINCLYLDRQYMLGDSLLVAPIFNEDGVADFYLPEGKWTNYFTGEVIEGGKARREKHGYLTVPLYVKENTVLPVTEKISKAGEDYSESLILEVYEITKKAELKVYVGKNQVISGIIEKTNDGLKVEYTAEKDFTLVIKKTGEKIALKAGKNSIDIKL